MKNESDFVILILILGVVTLLGCSAQQTPPVSPTSQIEPTPTRTFISEEKALELASKMIYCGSPHLRVMETPRNLKARLTTFGNTDLSAQAYYANEKPSPEMVVWVITMDGRWQSYGGPEPSPITAGQPATIIPPMEWLSCSVFINAQSGAYVGSKIGNFESAQPTRAK